MLEEAHLCSTGHRLGAAASPQLAVEVVYVGLDGAHRDEELTGYLLVGVAGGDEREHLQLPLAQRLRELFADIWGGTFLCENGQQLREVARRDPDCGGVAPLAGFEDRRQEFAHLGSLVHEGADVTLRFC